MNDPNCLFCKIIAKGIASYAIYEDDHTFAFLDVAPRTTGHVMVVPKMHVPDLLSLPDSEIAPLLGAIKKIDALLVHSLAPDGMTIGINQGKASGQEIDHLHVHLMPRWHGDGGGSVQSLVHQAPKESLENIRERILNGQ